MVELADAAPNPKAVVVEFANALIALPAVTAPVWLHNLALLTEALGRHLYYLN